MDPAPIPDWSEPPNWPRLPIRECGEPLVALCDSERLAVRPVYADLKIPGAPTTLFVRAGVRDRLLDAAARLPDGLALCVADGWRPVAVQQWLWDDYAATVRRERPELSGDALTEVVRQFVALPDPDPTCPPPHRTGAAVDVYLIDARTHRRIACGSPFDGPGPRAATRWYETRPRAPFTERRRILFHAMAAAGFANYLAEWWHYEWGNQRWANVVGADHAVYGTPPEEPQ